MIGDALSRFGFVLFRFKEIRDVVGHFDHVVNVHLFWLFLHHRALLQQGFLLVGEIAIVLLPLGRVRHQAHFHGGHFVFRAVGGPIGVFRGDHVGAADRMMERRIHHARLYAFGDFRF